MECELKIVTECLQENQCFCNTETTLDWTFPCQISTCIWSHQPRMQPKMLITSTEPETTTEYVTTLEPTTPEYTSDPSEISTSLESQISTVFQTEYKNKLSQIPETTENIPIVIVTLPPPTGAKDEGITKFPVPSESLLNVTSAIPASNVSRFAKNSYMASSTETNLAPPTLIGLTIGILSLYMINTGNSCFLGAQSLQIHNTRFFHGPCWH